jgi:hypothetical protein
MSRIGLVLRYFGIALAAAAALCGAATAQAPVSDGADLEPPALAANPARLADLAIFRRDFLDRDLSYSPDARAAAQARLAALIDAAGALSDAQIELELARIAALADNGHTNAFPAHRAARYNRIALRLAPFEGDFVVVRARGEHADLLGATLIGVDGRPFDETRAAAFALFGGPAQWRTTLAPFFFESPEQMHAAGVADAADAATYAFAMPDGVVVSRRIAAERGTPLWRGYDAHRWLWPERTAIENGDWRTLLPVERAPYAFTEAERAFRWRDAPELDAFIIELRQNRDALGASIADFLAQAARERAWSRRRNLILDMRFNSGGDLTTTEAYMRGFARSVRGRIVVLTSAWTFSAGIASIGYLKQAGGDRVTIIGEPAGDRLQFWAEGNFITLPGLQMRLLFADGYHDYLTGCATAICHPAVEFRPIAVASIAPDIAAPLTLAAYRAGRDPAMEAAAAFLAGQR